MVKRLGYHEAALEDVETALRSGYPEELRYKLLERKLNLLITLNHGEHLESVKQEFLTSVDTSNLSGDKKKILLESAESLKGFNSESKVLKQDLVSQTLTEAHAQLPCLSSKANVEFDKVRGRFVTANTSITSGEVILIEEAAVSLVKESDQVLSNQIAA